MQWRLTSSLLSEGIAITQIDVFLGTIAILQLWMRGFILVKDPLLLIISPSIL